MVILTINEEGNTYEKAGDINYKEDVSKVQSADRLRTSTNF